MQKRRARANGRPAVPPRRVAMVVYDDANTVDVTGPLEVFAAASRQLETAGPAPRVCQRRRVGERRDRADLERRAAS